MTLCDKKGGRGKKCRKKRDIINEWPLNSAYLVLRFTCLSVPPANAAVRKCSVC